jgi:hypothetical protein
VFLNIFFFLELMGSYWRKICSWSGDELVCHGLESKNDNFVLYIEAVFLIYTEAIWQVRWLILLLRVGTVWRCGDGPPLASDALLTTLHPLLENVQHTVCRKLQEDSGTGSFDVLTTLKTAARPLHCLHRLDGWVVGFLIHFFQVEHRIQSRNVDATLRK